jgi:asparagine synthase (glutamine-hydrolysing)
MDSSSIVCMADTILASGSAETPRLDTISYYDDSEPNWNERPYFTKVEEKRGRTGTHIDISKRKALEFEVHSDHFAATPASSSGHLSETTLQLAACMTSQRNRVVLSGVGGDEITGGVPTHTPELEDLLATGDVRSIAHQLKAWSLNKRKPWFHLLFDAARGFFPSALVGVPKHKRPAAWLNRAFVKRNRGALQGYESRLKFFGPLPTFQENLSTLDVLRRQLECSVLSSEPLYEKRYPYLDRGLLEFVYSVPREQIVRPGQRRSMMRRAMSGVVPIQILDRKRKGFVSRSPWAAIQGQLDNLFEATSGMVTSSMGVVDENNFVNALKGIRAEQRTNIVAVLRTFNLEHWLRYLRDRNLLLSTQIGSQPTFHRTRTRIPLTTEVKL